MSFPSLVRVLAALATCASIALASATSSVQDAAAPRAREGEVLRVVLRAMPDADFVRGFEQDLARAAAAGVRCALLELALPESASSRVEPDVLGRLRAALDPAREVRCAVLATWPGQGPAAALLCAMLPGVHALEGCESFRPSADAGLPDAAQIERLLVGVGANDAARKAARLAKLAGVGAEPLRAAEARALGLIAGAVPDREAFLAQALGLAGAPSFREGAGLEGGAPIAETSPSQAPPPAKKPGEAKVLRVLLRDTVDDAMVGQTHRALEKAEREGFDLVAFDIDTPGGAVVSMWAVAEAIGEYKAKGRRAVAYVSNHAISAGMVIALSCGTIWMRENSSIGAATPVMASPGGIEAPGDEGRTDSAEKVMSFFRADVRKLAQKTRGEASNAVPLAEAMVDRSIALVAFEGRDGKVKVYERKEFEDLKRQGQIREREGRVLEEWDDETLVTLTHSEAVRYGFADGVVPGMEGVLAKENLAGAVVEDLPMSWSEELVRALSAWSFLIFLAACVFAYVEFKLPGFGVPGITSIALFALLFFGKHLGGVAEVQEILLFFAGLVLIGIEVFVFPGTFLFGAAGAVCAILGLFLSFHGFFVPGNRFETETMLGNIGAFLAALAGTIVFGLAFGRYFPRLPFLGRLVSVPTDAGRVAWNEAELEGASPWLGRRGRALTDLRPAGKVRVDATVLDVVSEGDFVPAGTEVQVVRAEGRRLTVATPRAPRS